ncbi:hypothetical protein PLESTB_001102300 [Pleodorina starrii]|uniref:Uncharacterized protein n=1 Tax=Pleodorina starrii TaxID=330485 RepID=A0A9W6F4X9_9CHLO|nr:hypothetical protein PLESTB_001102300 [Pleodorina starrii]
MPIRLPYLCPNIPFKPCTAANLNRPPKPYAANETAALRGSCKNLIRSKNCRGSPPYRRPIMASAAPEGATDRLRRITSLAIGSDHPDILDLATAQSRAADRYHLNRVCTRQLLREAGAPAGGHREYGIYLGKGAVLALKAGGLQQLPGGQAGGAASAAEPPTIHLMHMFHFSRPGLTPPELRGEAALPGPVYIDWYDTQRPAADLLRLAPRLLGPLPPDLAHQMIPNTTAAGGDAGGDVAAAVASYIFAAWLAGLPLENPTMSAAAAAGTRTSPLPATAAAPPKWLAGLRHTFDRILRPKKSHAAGRPAAGAAPPPADAVEATAAAGAAGAAGAAMPPRHTLEEAWAEFERRVGEREVAMYGTSLEREWLAELGLMPAESGGGAAAGKA